MTVLGLLQINSPFTMAELLRKHKELRLAPTAAIHTLYVLTRSSDGRN